MKLLFLITTLIFSVACNKADHKAGATGSGAGVEQQEESQDANITTPIESDPNKKGGNE